MWWIQRETVSMLAQLPPETIDQIIEYLPSREDTRSIALVCSALRPHAYRRLFESLRVFVERGNIVPVYAELILFYPHLLQYPTHLSIYSQRRAPKSVYSHEHGEISTIPVHYLWTHLINMPRLTFLGLYSPSGDYSAVLSVLEGLGTARSITLSLCEKIRHAISISEKSLPVKCLTLRVDEPSHRLEKQLLQKCSQSLYELRLALQHVFTPEFPFLPHLRIFSLWVPLGSVTDGHDLTPLLPIFMQHPSLTSVKLDATITSINPVHPDCSRTFVLSPRTR